MKFITFVSSKADIKACQKSSNIEEVLISPQELSREGKLDLAQSISLAKSARENNLKPVLVWDILMPEEAINLLVQKLRKIDLSLFFAVRVQDTGALQFIKDEYPEIPIQLIVETGNANLPALKRWAAYLGGQLNRLILSIQLTEETVIEYVKELSVECEILAAGPILLFYSPRSLLAQKMPEVSDEQGWLYALSSSEESHNRPFPTIENSHGTFMYLNKDLFILDKLQSVAEAGVSAARIDLRQLSKEPDSAQGIIELLEQVQRNTINPKEHWPNPAFAPFFRRNNTTRQFSKLKPAIYSRRDDTCVARVLLGNKPYQMVIWALRDFSVKDKYLLALPDGKEVECGQLEFRDLSGNKVVKVREDQLLTTGWVKRCCAGALLVEN